MSDAVNGCLSGIARLVGLAAVVAAAVAIWWFREPILRTEGAPCTSLPDGRRSASRA